MTCHVYHISRRSSLGDLSDGYVGVSSDPEYRWMRHIRYEKNSRIKRAYEKYDDVEIRIISSGSREFCFALEAMLRPSPRMGWNLVPGGGNPPCHKGKPRSKEHSQKIKKARQLYVWVVEGVEFDSQQEAADKTGYDRGTIRRRIGNDAFPDWYKHGRNSRKMRRDPTFTRNDY